MEETEDGDLDAGRDWLDGRRGLDRESLKRVESERDRGTSVTPGVLARLSRVRRATSAPLRLAAGGVRWARAQFPDGRAESEEAEQPTPIADGSDSSAHADHHVGTRTARPEPVTDDTPVIEEPSEFKWGGDVDEGGDEHPATATDD